jgi:hypothetical protein
MSSEEGKEITVRAPSKSPVSDEKKSEKAAEKSLEEERFEVLQFPKRIRRYVGVISVLFGFLLLFLFVYLSVAGDLGGVLLSSTGGSFSLILWGFVGSLNIFIGFLFLGRE